jgi:signal transduction histidine kinase
LLHETTRRFRERFEESGLAIREQIPEGLPTVFADPNRLQQVLDNLLENAVCYVEAPGTVQVRVEAQQDGVLLSVEDTGPGIPAAALPHLFDRFYRVEQFRSRESGGSGLLDDAIGSVYGVGYHFQLPESPQPRP